MTKLYLTKTILNEDKKIELAYEFSTAGAGRKLEDMESIVKKFNEAIETFQKDEKSKDSKPEENFIHYNRICKYCNGKNCVTVIKDPFFPNIQKEKLYCLKCQRTWPYTSRASSTPTHDEKLIQSIQVMFKGTRAKLYEEGTPLANLSELETMIIQRIIYG